jgi:hypothetical protein
MADEEDPVVVLEGDDDSLMLGMSAVEDSQRPLRPRRRRLKGKKVGACPGFPKAHAFPSIAGCIHPIAAIPTLCLALSVPVCINRKGEWLLGMRGQGRGNLTTITSRLSLTRWYFVSLGLPSCANDDGESSMHTSPPPPTHAPN